MDGRRDDGLQDDNENNPGCAAEMEKVKKKRKRVKSGQNQRV